MLALSVPVSAAAAEQTAPAKREVVRVFLDCDRCDEEYLRRKSPSSITSGTVRTRTLHVLVTTQGTGGGGTQWTLQFIGIGLNLSNQTLTYNSPQTATSDEVRSGFAEVFKVGLRALRRAELIADRLRVTSRSPKGPTRPRPSRIPGLLDLPREWRRQLQRGRVVDGAIRRLFGEPDDGCVAHLARGERQLPRQRVRAGRRLDVPQRVPQSQRRGGILVKSLTQHWSLGGIGGANTFQNFALKTRIAPGIEYDIYPYRSRPAGC